MNSYYRLVLACNLPCRFEVHLQTNLFYLPYLHLSKNKTLLCFKPIFTYVFEVPLMVLKMVCIFKIMLQK